MTLRASSSEPPLGSPAQVLDLAHALRTPLTSLALGLGLLEDGALGALNEAQRDVVKTLVREIERLTLLVDRDLDTRPLGAYAGPPLRLPTDLLALTSAAAAPIERQARERGVVLSVRGEGGVVVSADPVKLGWVAVSLMGSALRFSPEGATIDVAIGTAFGEAQLSVRDRGPGLEAGARLFDRDGGTGLFLAREIIEHHGGRIAARAATDGAPGTVFTIMLPLATTPQEETER